MLVASKDVKIIEEVKVELKSRFEMKDLGEASKIFGMEILRDRKERILTISQESYMKKLSQKHGIGECKASSIPIGVGVQVSSLDCPSSEEEIEKMAHIPYASIVGSLMYAMVCTRPDLAYPLSILSRFMSNPGEKHWSTLKMVLRYVKDTMSYGLIYGIEEKVEKSYVLVGFTDSDYGRCLDSRKSLSGYCFKLYGSLVSWRSGLQQVVALSTTESEYMAATECIKEALWLQGLLKELGVESRPTQVFSDSQSAIHLMKNPTFHNRSKHIHVRLHFIRQVIDQGDVIVGKVNTQLNPADLFTKPLVRARMEELFMLMNYGAIT